MTDRRTQNDSLGMVKRFSTTCPQMIFFAAEDTEKRSGADFISN
jgi:hypothetical protein